MNKDRIIKKITGLAIIAFSFSAQAQQSGGMWIPTEINETEMKAMGMKVSAKDIFDPLKPSIEDAVPQFNGGCTSEIISPNGLLLTNHHCGYSMIQSHSSVDHNYLKNGFWAKNYSEELPNPGANVAFITDIIDITPKILSGTENMTAAELGKTLKERMDEVLKNTPKGKFEELEIKPMYAGNKYYLYKKLIFKDIRLVGTPPESIGKFGSDTDNWVWPRHTGDFSIFRIYANKNNEPAEYSGENVPYKPKHFLPVSIKGIKENDFTFVYGFPGRTNEYLPAIALEKTLKETNPARIEVRDLILKNWDEKMRSEEAIKIKYASKYASLANYWKKWIGENQGLERSNAVKKRKDYEQFLISKNPAIAKTIAELEDLYQKQAPHALHKAYFDEISRGAEILRVANFYAAAIDLADASKLDANNSKRVANALKAFYKDYDAALDLKLSAKLLTMYSKKVSADLLPEELKILSDEQKCYEWLQKNSSFLSNSDFVNSLKDETFSKENVASMKSNPVVVLFRNMKSLYTEKSGSTNDALQGQIDLVQKRFMAEQMKTDTQKKYFPDANSTLRVTYGRVKGSNVRDGVSYHYQTYLDGVMEKYKPGDYEFDVPAELLEIYKNKDFGQYADQTGRVPVAFTATNHTTGGNSGSPAIDARGNLVGLNFDRQWEGTMSDLNYDPEICRNIMVDTRYVLFIIEKIGKATWLIDEMKLVK
ncbi:MAG: S46 family peptidase [Cytophagaceae bacterium]|nr:S46 family peptidase [Cytophagaceae bacterium]MBL0300881.1 S46 family peptidase [Cytophagaceae bacterium]MBL0323693.1 S46 family peptidase [Cytophagaceae bacterium]